MPQDPVIEAQQKHQRAAYAADEALFQWEQDENNRALEDRHHELRMAQFVAFKELRPIARAVAEARATSLANVPTLKPQFILATLTVHGKRYFRQMAGAVALVSETPNGAHRFATDDDARACPAFSMNFEIEALIDMGSLG